SRADDLAQETFMSVLSKPFEERAPKATRSYLRKTARLIFLDQYRTEKRRDELLRSEVAEKVWRRRVKDGSGNEYLEALERCLDTLAETPRRVMELRFREGSSGSQVASELSISEANVHTIASRAKDV